MLNHDDLATALNDHANTIAGIAALAHCDDIDTDTLLDAAVALRKLAATIRTETQIATAMDQTTVTVVSPGAYRVTNS